MQEGIERHLPRKGTGEDLVQCFLLLTPPPPSCGGGGARPRSGCFADETQRGVDDTLGHFIDGAYHVGGRNAEDVVAEALHEAVANFVVGDPSVFAVS